MSHTTIPFSAVRMALKCAVIKKKPVAGIDGDLCRAAAYSRYEPFTAVTCRTARPGQRRRNVPSAHFGAMNRGDLDRVLERVRLLHGLAEVRRTWGLGTRALRAEFGNGVMR